MDTTTGRTCDIALSKLESLVGPLAWNAGWEPFADQDDIGKAVRHIHKAMTILKRVRDRQAERRKLVTCRECQEQFELQDCPEGVCSECDVDGEECPTCEGTGLDPEPDFDDEDLNSDCPDCGGDGVV